MRLWKTTKSDKRSYALVGTNGRFGLMYSRDAKLVAFEANDNAIMLWEVATGRRINQLTVDSDNIVAVTASPDGVLMSTSANGIQQFWDVEAGKQLEPRLEWYSEYNDARALNFECKKLVRGSSEGIELWSIPSKDLTVLKKDWQISPGKGKVWNFRSVALSPDGKTIASCRNRDIVELWDASTQSKRADLRGHDGAVYSLAFSPDGATLASGGADAIVLWDVANEMERMTLKRENATPVHSMVFAPDGRTLASASTDGIVQLWIAATDKQVLDYKERHAKALGNRYDVALAYWSLYLNNSGGSPYAPRQARVALENGLQTLLQLREYLREQHERDPDHSELLGPVQEGWIAEFETELQKLSATAP